MHKVMKDVRAFHVACDVPVLEAPQFPARDRIELRDRLLTEEYGELLRAIAARDIVGTAGEIADMIYILAGTALEFGIPLDAVWDEVQRANMAKVGPDGKAARNEAGKILKPKGWSPPRLADVIRMNGAPKRLIALDEVSERVAVSKATIRRWAAEGTFPKPRKLSPHGRRVAWLESEVVSWMNGLAP